MNARSSGSTRALAFGSFAVIAVLGVAAALFHALSWEVPTPPMLFGPRGFVAALGLVLGASGMVIASRRPANAIGWICLGAGLLATLNGLAEAYAFWALLGRGGAPPLALWAAWMNEWIYLLYLGALGLTAAIFPDGRWRSSGWRNVILIGCAGTAVATAGNALVPDLVIFSGFDNPVGLRGVDADTYLQVVSGIAWIFGLLVIVGGAASASARFRHSRGDERQQLKWLALAAALIAVVTTSYGVITVVAGSPGVSPTGFDWAEYLVTASVFALPIAIAILKYRLYDIDVIINRALVYGILTAALALVYAGGVVGVGAVARGLSGQENNNLGVATSTLVVAALFRPLRRRVQSFIDRRFYRHKYDAQQTLAEFSVRLRDEVDLDSLNAELVGVVTRTMQPSRVSLWLKPPRPTTPVRNRASAARPGPPRDW